MVTDQQVRRLRRLDLCGLSKERVADKAGMDAKTARNYRRLGKLPSEVRRMERDYRLQGRDDDGGGDRPLGASLRDCGVEHRQLSSGAGEEGWSGCSNRLK